MGRPTMKDVARLAGVSVSTVSYALNETSTIALADDTKARVRRAAREIGYVPNGVARSLRSQASRTVGMVLGKPLASPRYAAIAGGLASGLRERGFRLAVIDEPDAATAVDEVRGRLLDGLVFVGHDDQGVPDDLSRAVVEHHVPFVAVDCASPADAAYASVDFDYAVGVQQALADIARRGVEHVLYVRPDIDSAAESMRASAIVAAEQEHPGVRVHPFSSGLGPAALSRLDADRTAWPARSRELAERIVEALSGFGAASSAVLCAWGADAEPAYRAAREAGSHVRVTALAAGSLSEGLWPGLAYSRLPLERAGRESARLVTSLSHDEPERILLTPELTTHE
ncbi:DNA-binding LacI/PurR family transcriptional regulator [Microbacterium sp. AG1240]|uniref:LacI family DNA-binding transcriptional regulator n=1 Tax=Microbacterium sp. AG1240 TaxID=2183992 RepID=UPI000EAB7D00|nr:LacI family DNA-binding transcriptional regulator [Microbacterium sp. AG1240]RKT35684.1 DNA-binding LacI/PurR family transcriptional regulator [Microbacterium sp. AG1240]